MDRRYDIRFTVLKEDYKDWIHYNVEQSSRGKNKNFRIGAVVCYLTIALACSGYNILHGGDIRQASLSFLVGLGICGYILYTTSPKGIEAATYKKHGLHKLEKTKNYQELEVYADDEKCVMTITSTGQQRTFSYQEFLDVIEIDRIYMITTSENRVQFICKSAFQTAEEGEEFIAFIKEKIADAKENPDKYPIPENPLYNPWEDEENSEEAEETEAAEENESGEEAAEETTEEAEESAEVKSEE